MENQNKEFFICKTNPSKMFFLSTIVNGKNYQIRIDGSVFFKSEEIFYKCVNENLIGLFDESLSIDLENLVLVEPETINKFTSKEEFLYICAEYLI